MAVSISLSITQNSQSIVNNTSNVTVKVTAKWTYGSWNATVDASGQPQANGTVKIDGTSYTFRSTFNTKHTTSGSQTIFTKTVDVKHADNGSKTLSCSASYNTYVSSGTVECSGSKALTTIPRKSTLSVANGTLGTAQTLTVARKSTSFTHTIVAKCGTSSSTVCTKSSSTSISFTPPIAWSSKNTTGTTVSVTYTITTYSGDTNVGSNTYTKTCSIPPSVKPSCSVSLSDATDCYTKFGNFVKGYSKFKVTVTPTKAYDSPIDSYKTTANGVTYNTASFTTGFIKSSGTLTVSATVTDKRGRTSTAATKTGKVLDYSAPVISQLKVVRCNQNGTENDQGEYVSVDSAYFITDLNEKNTGTIEIKYKKTSSSNYTTLSSHDVIRAGVTIADACVFPADTGSSYEVVVTVTDALTSTTKTTVASTAYTIMHWKANGRGMGIGKISELDDVLDVDYTIFARNGIRIPNNVRFSGIAADGTSKSIFTAQSENDNVVLGRGNYDAKSGDTYIYGNDVITGVSSIATPATYRLYRRKGDSVTLSIKTAGYVTNGGKDVGFWIPFTIPILGNPTVTVTSGTGFALRQGSLYTHGSGASTTVSPDSYSATLYYMHGISVTATFSNTTNVTNNDAIGIYWNGTITFS